MELKNLEASKWLNLRLSNILVILTIHWTKRVLFQSVKEENGNLISNAHVRYFDIISFIFVFFVETKRKNLHDIVFAYMLAKLSKFQNQRFFEFSFWLNFDVLDYIPYSKVEKSYKFHDKPQKWFDARETCLKENATLAMPENEAEVLVLVELFKEYLTSILKYENQPEFILLGFHDIFKKGDFITDQGSDTYLFCNPFNYFF